MSEFRIIVGDCLSALARLPEQSVQTCVTSPPYWGLRDYGSEGQLGLEPTPEEYVANMVEVFRGVRRVLRDDGTLWLNLGDSYYSPTATQGRNEDKSVGTIAGLPQVTNMGASTYRRDVPGLKPKDLVGIPWMVAFALRQPYYTGTIKDERDRIWLAAMIDAEGCIYIHKRKAGASNGQGYERKNDSYGAGMEVSNTSRAIVERVQALTGRGSISEQAPSDGRRKQTLYRWNLRTNECRDVLREVYPYLVAKQHQARVAIGCPSSGERAEAAHEALKGLHGGGLTDVDFPEPAGMTEPGWYLRSDCIWSKPNPMPESVTDRPTKAHEYLFLLSKSQRYFYDADAIREGWADERNGNAGARGNYAEGAGRAGGGDRSLGLAPMVSGRNKRSVWTVTTQPFPGAHFATFPPKLIEPCILAGSSTGDTVLDPFNGAGTTGVVALRHDRDYTGIELNPEYAQMARERIYDDAPLLNLEAA